jgi:hypothetical protein
MSALFPGGNASRKKTGITGEVVATVWGVMEGAHRAGPLIFLNHAISGILEHEPKIG